jgi:hypothetical protein
VVAWGKDAVSAIDARSAGWFDPAPRQEYSSKGGSSSGGAVIFSLIEDNRSAITRAWSLAASLAVNICVLGGMFIAVEIFAARNAHERLLAEWKAELERYRFITLEEPFLPAAPPAVRERTSESRRRSPAPVVSDSRYIERLGGEARDLVEQDEVIRNILSRELVRDVDQKVLDLSRLLQSSVLRLHFETDEQGRITERGIDESPGVPSIDHLTLELIRLLEEYGLLRPLGEVRRFALTIRVAETVDVEIQGEARDSARVEDVRKLAQTLLTLARFTLLKEAVFLVQDVGIEVSDTGVRLTRSYEKSALVEFLQRYLTGEVKSPSPETEIHQPPPP